MDLQQISILFLIIGQICLMLAIYFIIKENREAQKDETP